MEKDFLRNFGAVILGVVAFGICGAAASYFLSAHERNYVFGIAALLMIPAVAYGVYRLLVCKRTGTANSVFIL